MKRGAQRKVKALEKQVRVERGRERNLYRMIQELLGQNVSNISPYQLSILSEQLRNKSHQDIDIGYLRTVLFPELYFSDVPQPLSNVAFSRFTDKTEFTISTGSDGNNGSGVLIWYPKTNSGPALFGIQCNMAPTNQLKVADISAIPPLITSGGGDNALHQAWAVGDFQNYQTNFSQTCLVSASISIQYTGSIQAAQGYFIGGSLLGTQIGGLTIDDIENAQNKTRCFALDGIRLVHLPKDATDFQYYPTSTTQAHNGGSGQGNEDYFKLQGTTTLAAYRKLQEGDVTNTYAVAPPFMQYQTNVPSLAIYWKGMPQNQNVLRVELIRRFNGMPKSSIRDIVDVQKPVRTADLKKTQDVLSALQLSVPQLAGHSLKDMDQISDRIQAHLPNVGHLYTSGQLRDGMSLDMFAGRLATGAAGNGNIVLDPSRILDTD